MLTQAQYDALKREAGISSISMGEYVRRALNAVLGIEEPRRVRGVEVKLAVWREPDAAVVGKRLRRTKKRRRKPG